jgi:methionine--tRNA ligase beta chain
MRVGLIVSVKRHPDAETLYVEEVDCGEPEPRTVVSGLVKYIKEEDFHGKKVVLLCNLKPAKMRGIESQAMVLCATSTDGNTVELVEPHASSKPGDVVTFEGFKGFVSLW